jgi:hypothetical protein
MSLAAVHIPEVPVWLENSRRLREYIDDYLHIGAVSHIDIVNRKDSGTSMAFIHFKCQWNNGKPSNMIRKAIVEKGFWEEKLRPGFGFLDWLPKGDVKQVRLIKSEPDYKANANANAKKSVDDTKEQYALIAKLDSVKIEAQSALIAQLCKELTSEREKNRFLEQKLDDVYKTMFGAAKYDEQLDMVNISQLLNLDDLLSD